MNRLFYNPFANPDKSGQVVRKIITLSIICMLLLTVAGCENVKEPYADDEENEERKCECDFDDDFDLSELSCHSGRSWAVGLTLKSEVTDCPIENPVIKALITKHELTFYQSYPGTSLPILMRYYTLVGKNCHSLCYAKTVIRAFLATGLFEHHIRIFERTFPLY